MNHLLKTYADIFLLFTFWQIVWFNLTALSIIISAGIAIYRIQLKAFREKNLELQAKAEEYKELLEYADKAKALALERAAVVKRTNDLLISKMSHQIRTSIYGVIGMAGFLSETSLSSDQIESVNTIRKSSEMLLKSTDELIKNDFTKLPKNLLEATFRNQQKNSETKKIDKKKVTEDFCNEFPLTILIVEDDTINQQIITKILNRLGYNPDCVNNGKEALEIVSEKNYDIILLDSVMPVMNGFEVTRMIRLCLDIQPTIIAMTASALEGDREKCLQAGMDDYMSKPVYVNELVSMLEKWAAIEKNNFVRT
ncbi:MAG: response regulator [Parafilimonas sp.]